MKPDNLIRMLESGYLDPPYDLGLPTSPVRTGPGPILIPRSPFPPGFDKQNEMPKKVAVKLINHPDSPRFWRAFLRKHPDRDYDLYLKVVFALVELPKTQREAERDNEKLLKAIDNLQRLLLDIYPELRGMDHKYVLFHLEYAKKYLHRNSFSHLPKRKRDTRKFSIMTAVRQEFGLGYELLALLTHIVLDVPVTKDDARKIIKNVVEEEKELKNFLAKFMENYKNRKEESHDTRPVKTHQEYIRELEDYYIKKFFLPELL